MKIIFILAFLVGQLQAGDRPLPPLRSGPRTISLQWVRIANDRYDLRMVSGQPNQNGRVDIPLFAGLGRPVPVQLRPPFQLRPHVHLPGQPVRPQAQPQAQAQGQNQEAATTEITLRYISPSEFDPSKTFQRYEMPTCKRRNIRGPARSSPERKLSIASTGWTREKGLRYETGRTLTLTCTIDSFLTSFMFLVYRQSSFVERNFGLVLDKGEVALSIISNLAKRRDFRNPDIEIDHAIKRSWVETGMNKKLPFACGDNEDQNIWDNLKDSSRLMLLHTCDCMVNGENGQVDEQGYLEMTPEKLKVLQHLPTRPGVIPTRRDKAQCTSCQNDFKFAKAVVGNCTWFIKFKPKDTPAAVDPLKWPRYISFSNIEMRTGNSFKMVTFEKTYFSFVSTLENAMVPVNEDEPLPGLRRAYRGQRDVTENLVSFHFIDEKIFLYDNLVGDGEMKLIRSPMHYVLGRRMEPETIVYVKTDL